VAPDILELETARMAQVFKRGSNALARASIILGVVGIGVVGAIIYLAVRSDSALGVGVPPPQPVPFSHAHHSGGDGIHCLYCHTNVEKSNYAKIPPTETCMNCHSQIWADSPNLEPVRESWRTGEPIRWNLVHDIPDFVYFNHSIHIKKGIGCSSCHGNVTEMNMTWKDQSMNMAWCLDCHGQPEKYVRPRSEIYNPTYPREQPDRALGHQLVREYGIQKKVHCYACHR
jgi:ferredoxin